MAPPVKGVQKTSPRPENQFLDRHLAALEKGKVNKPAGLKMRPAWWRRDHLGACPVLWIARPGIRFCAGLEAADRDDLVP